MASIFISYRRGDSPGSAGRICDRLRSSFGADQVFMDTESIRSGSDFRHIIGGTIEECDVMLVVIGQHWLERADDIAGDDAEEDWIEEEVTAALEYDITVVPVLVDGAPMPSTQDLPERLKGLAFLHAFEMSPNRFSRDLELLEDEIRHSVGTRRHRPWRLVGVGRGPGRPGRDRRAGGARRVARP